jgi:pimeloyl-ACP methyl ester carboxylesterase
MSVKSGDSTSACMPTAAMRRDPAAVARFREDMRAALDRLRALAIPTVALIEGHCYGAGVALMALLAAPRLGHWPKRTAIRCAFAILAAKNPASDDTDQPRGVGFFFRNDLVVFAADLSKNTAQDVVAGVGSFRAANKKYGVHA